MPAMAALAAAAAAAAALAPAMSRLAYTAAEEKESLETNVSKNVDASRVSDEDVPRAAGMLNELVRPTLNPPAHSPFHPSAQPVALPPRRPPSTHLPADGARPPAGRTIRNYTRWRAVGRSAVPCCPACRPGTDRLTGPAPSAVPVTAGRRCKDNGGDGTPDLMTF